MAILKTLILLVITGIPSISDAFSFKVIDLVGLPTNKSIQIANKKQGNRFVISGTISDKSTGETLIGAAIVVKAKNKGVISNEYGFYSLELLEDENIIEVSYLGYKTIELLLDLAENQNINVELEPENNNLDEVVISTQKQNKSQLKTVIAGTTTLNSKDIKAAPAFFGEPDITRVMLTQAGVSSNGEGTSGFNVRGGNIDQNLILLDEAPLYNSSHIWGFFSIFNVDAIKDIKLYKGDIPARFGGRASSVLDIRLKEGSLKKFKGEGGVGVLFSRLTLEGPIKKDVSSFLISARRSYFDIFLDKSSDVYFQDLSAKLSWQINQKNKLFVSGYLGSDVMGVTFEQDITQDGETEVVKSETKFKWTNSTASIRWNHLFSSKTFMNISAIYSRYDYLLSSENSGSELTESNATSFEWTSVAENWILKADLTKFINPKTKIRFGINNTIYKFSPTKIKSNATGLPNINFDSDRALEIAPYFEFIKSWGKLSLNTGLRYSLYANIGAHTLTQYAPGIPESPATISGSTSYKKNEIIKRYDGFEPRLSFKYDLSDRKALKFGLHRMYQFTQLISNTAASLPFDIWKLSDPYIKPLKVNQISVGYAYDTENRAYNFSADGYYKTFKDIIEYKNGADLFLQENIESQLIPAKGFAYGIELAVHKNNGPLKGSLNYTFSRAKRKTEAKYLFDNINNGDYFPSNFDRPHMLNLTTNYKLNKKWSFGLFFTYQTGRPLTRPTGKLDINGETYFTFSDRNAYRVSDTHRMDFSFNYNATGNPNTAWKGSWSFGLYNVYARKNTFSEYTSYEDDKVRAYKFSVLGGIFPFITYNFKF
jgi:outer membrane cobalamin receptor|tara:strand:- start:880 stop:3354 length:2475 start_codon:yes stop_codon:yes gene_type:complete